MTGTKKWVNNFYNESQDSKSSTQTVPTISWSSSDSDSDDFSYTTLGKRRKLYSNKKEIKKWMKGSDISCILKSSNRGAQILKLVINNQPLSETLNTEELSQCARINIEDSPIVGSTKLEELSPVLTQQSTLYCDTKDTSPVIGKSRFYRKFSKKYHSNEMSPKFKHSSIDQESPDLFPSQQIECDSPDLKCSLNESSISLSPVKTISSTLLSQHKYKIEPVSSQDSSNIEISSNSPSVSNKSELLAQYYQPPLKKRKKKFKQGSLANRLHSLLKLQKNTLAIWQHEIYLNKTNYYENVVYDSTLTISFVVNCLWDEFGSWFYECSHVEDVSIIPDSCEKLQNCSDLCDKNIENNNFLLVLNSTVTPKTELSVDKRCKLYPPYSKKVICYKEKQTNCYFNISKLYCYF